eukprot:scpid94224/ scgid15272/ 
MESVDPKPRRNTRQSVQAPIVEPGRQTCIFCGSLKKKIPGKSTKQTTSLLQSEDGEQTLRAAAEIRQDDKILIAIGSSCLIAREAYYHKYCYREYTRAKTLARLQDQGESAATCAPVASAGTEIDKDFFTEVETLLFVECLVRTVSDLTRLFNQVSIEGTALARNERVKGLLMDKYGESITFSRPRARNKSELVYATERAPVIILIARLYDRDAASESESEESGDSPSASACESQEGIASTTTSRSTNYGTRAPRRPAEVDVHQTVIMQDSIRLVYHSARLLRNACQQQAESFDTTSTSPGSSTGMISVKQAEQCIPALLHNFLVWFLSSGQHDNIPAASSKLEVDSTLNRCV